MGSGGSFDFGELRELQRQLENLQSDRDRFCRECAKELTARLLSKVKRRTPVGQYPSGSGRTGGTLRRNWTIGTIQKAGDVYKIEIINPTEYASYVEYGHRQEPGRFIPALGKRAKKAWVPGQFMMAISERELQEVAPAILERKVQRWLEEAFHA